MVWYHLEELKPLWMRETVNFINFLEWAVAALTIWRVGLVPFGGVEAVAEERECKLHELLGMENGGTRHRHGFHLRPALGFSEERVEQNGWMCVIL